MDRLFFKDSRKAVNFFGLNEILIHKKNTTFPRYPLIIDPSGQATEFIMNEYKDCKIIRTSFLDDAFRKNLESALRFGNPLLVQVRTVSSWSIQHVPYHVYLSN